MRGGYHDCQSYHNADRESSQNLRGYYHRLGEWILGGKNTTNTYSVGAAAVKEHRLSSQGLQSPRPPLSV